MGEFLDRSRMIAVLIFVVTVAAIVLISSELPEVMGMADRIVVMHDGRITGEIADVRRATQEQIMELAVQ